MISTPVQVIELRRNMASHVFILSVLSIVVLSVVANPMNDDERPFDCPANEQYYKCAAEICYTKCQHLKTPPGCPLIAAGCFQPACLCVDGYLRNDEGVCVPTDQCNNGNISGISKAVLE